MKEDLKNFIKGAKGVGLSPSERSVLREKIMEFISFNPIRGKAPMLRDKNYISIFEVRHFMKAASLVLIFAVVVGGSGISYAASNALPGETLYMVKVNINEGIEETFATSAKARLAVQSEHIQRRLDEVQTLRKENKLSPKTQNIVIAKLDEHTASASKSIDQLREEGDVSAVLEATSNLTPIFEANKDLLEKENNKADIENEIDDTDTLIAKIDDSSKIFQDQENSVIASVDDESTNDPMTMSMSKAIPQDSSLATKEETNKATNKAEREVKEISNQIYEIIEERIDTAKEKINQIKKEISEEKAIIDVIPKPIETPLIEEPTAIPTIESEATLEADKTTTLSRLQTNIPISLPEEKIDTTTTATDKPVIETAPIVEADAFDTVGKIALAELLIKDAEKLLGENKFKEALTVAQEVNRIAGEIETHRRLEALDLAKKESLDMTQKATVSESIKN